MGELFELAVYLASWIHDLASMKHCEKCGAEYYDQKFCSRCGAKLVPAKPPHDDNLLE